MTADWATAAVADNFVIHTSRLLIRPLAAGDEQLYLDMYTSAQVMAYIGPPLDVDKAKHSFQIALRLNANIPFKRLFLAICIQDQLIGLSAVNQWDAKQGMAEVGVMLVPARQRQGYGTEVLLALSKRLLQLFKSVRLYADMNPKNKAVTQLFTTSGFSPDPTRPGRYWLRLN
jgi:RimJ/RimL family protein N-acetyltransferase